MPSDSPKPDEQADWSSESLLADLQDASFQYFVEVVNPQNGLVRDRNRVGAPASIAATGMGLSALPIGVARSVVSREKAAEYTLTTLRFLYELPQGPEPVSASYKGFFYHDLHTALIQKRGATAADFNRAVYERLKPGGFYVVVDHAAAVGTGTNDAQSLHRIDPASVREEVEAAGFVLDAESTILANKDDPHALKIFDPSIKGETDRFAFRFVKP